MSDLDLEAILKRAVTLSAFFDEYLESVKPSEEKPTGDLVCCACAEYPSECGETCLRLMATDASMSTHDIPALCDEVERLTKDRDHWRANHDEMKARNDVLQDLYKIDK